jgi:integrase
MKATTVLLARSKRALESENGKKHRPFIPVVIKRDKPVKPGPDSYSYYARYSGLRTEGKLAGTKGRIVTPLGDNLDAAYVQFLNIDTVQKQIRAGHDVAMPIPSADGNLKLTDAIDQYLEDAKSSGNAVETLSAKKRILNQFQQVAAKRGVLSVAALKDPNLCRMVSLDYLRWMEENLPKQQVSGKRPENTYHKNMQKLSSFLRQHGIKVKKEYSPVPGDPGVLRREEFPKYKSGVPAKYSKTTIQSMLSVATEDEADLIQFFLFTGFRDEEVAYVEWSDVNFTDLSINVHAKPQTAARPWAWKPKDDESREIDIPLSKEFVNRLKRRQKRHAKQQCALIFPSGACKPDSNLLRRIRVVAKRAGITQPVALHKFRRTFGSDVAKEYGIEIARKYLGHADIDTTQRYLVADSDDVQKVRETIGTLQAAYIA